MDTAFRCLYGEDIISEKAIVAWENCKDPAELNGKGVVMLALTQFLIYLKEADEGDEVAVDDDDDEEDA
jgi:translation initiation factor 4G